RQGHAEPAALAEPTAEVLVPPGEPSVGDGREASRSALLVDEGADLEAKGVGGRERFAHGWFAQRGHRPSHTGRRFSAKARAPSRASREARTGAVIVSWCARAA